MINELAKKSEILKALGNPVRLKLVVGLVGNKECNVNKMAEHLAIPQSTVSQHLSVLRHKGIITPKKRGVETCYEVVDKMVLDLLLLLEKS